MSWAGSPSGPPILRGRPRPVGLALQAPGPGRGVRLEPDPAHPLASCMFKATKTEEAAVDTARDSHERPLEVGTPGSCPCQARFSFRTLRARPRHNDRPELTILGQRVSLCLQQFVWLGRNVSP